MRHRGAEREACQRVMRGDFQALEVAARLHGQHGSDIGDQAGEHSLSLVMDEAVRAQQALFHQWNRRSSSASVSRAVADKASTPLAAERLRAGEQHHLVGEALARSARRRRAGRLRKTPAKSRAPPEALQRGAQVEAAAVQRAAFDLDAQIQQGRAARRIGAGAAEHQRRNLRARRRRGASAAAGRAGRRARRASGWRSQPGRRTVISGSSPSTVPIPTMMASCMARNTWVRRLAARPVMARRRSCSPPAA